MRASSRRRLGLALAIGVLLLGLLFQFSRSERASESPLPATPLTAVSQGSTKPGEMPEPAVVIGDDELDSDATEAPDVPSSTVWLQRRYKDGELYVLALNSELEYTREVDGQSVGTSRDALSQEIGIFRTRERVDGSQDLQFGIRVLSFERIRPSGTLTFDLESGTGGTRTREVQRFIDEVRDTRYRLLLGPAGNLRSVQSSTRFRTQNPLLVPVALAVSAESYEQALALLSAEARRRRRQPGDRWSERFDAQVGPSPDLSVEVEYYFRDWSERQGLRCARIECTGTLTLAGNPPGVSRHARVTIEDASVSGEAFFAEQLGLVVWGSMELRASVRIDDRGETRRTVLSHRTRQRLVEVRNTEPRAEQK